MKENICVEGLRGCFFSVERRSASFHLRNESDESPLMILSGACYLWIHVSPLSLWILERSHLRKGGESFG